MTPHLTHEQLCDLVIAEPDISNSASEAAHDHLRACLLCTAELQNLRASLSLFRNATHSYARQEFARPTVNKASIAPSPGYLSHALYWAAAAVVAVAVALPVGLHQQHSPVPQSSAAAVAAPQTTESDEALLEGIAQDLSTDVPAPMRPLADPTASTATQSNFDQRKN
jgi:hypothetical protein